MTRACSPRESSFPARDHDFGIRYSNSSVIYNDGAISVVPPLMMCPGRPTGRLCGGESEFLRVVKNRFVTSRRALVFVVSYRARVGITSIWAWVEMRAGGLCRTTTSEREIGKTVSFCTYTYNTRVCVYQCTPVAGAHPVCSIVTFVTWRAGRRVHCYVMYDAWAPSYFFHSNFGSGIK